MNDITGHSSDLLAKPAVCFRSDDEVLTGRIFARIQVHTFITPICYVCGELTEPEIVRNSLGSFYVQFFEKMTNVTTS